MTQSISIGRVRRVIYLGAEALVAEGEFLGYGAVFKLRLRKPYRAPELDREIVSRRTAAEARTMLMLKQYGVSVPRVLFVDPLQGLIIMEKVEGAVLRNALEALGREEACRAMVELGREVGKMHKLGVSHGDVTTSNAVLRPDGSVYILDLGLSKHVEDVEDLAVDVHLLIRVLESSHHSAKEDLMKCFMRGYRSVVGSEVAGKVLEKVAEIRMRGRYVEERRVRKST
ncbi:MAG: Kae1-associated kinase Bud32 [Sulfolobales archaeon]|nr:Kae1-associated kinase Bud32 [Sulfolobales archaeon]MCX8209040.1 Kae1-associated kinase Bud32 [Sulfolobales archaeon]MDW8010071.1 Kae1-associated kinase Bud32 [Sulfolobales archaeon]